MKIALASVYNKNTDLDYNFGCIKNIYEKAVKESVELLIFPHLMINGLQIDLNNLEYKRYYELLDNIIDLTHSKNCAILIGGIYIKENEFKEEIYDSVFFIKKSVLERVISRKTINKNNILEDNRIFEKGIFLDAFEYEKKRFNVLISDDIFHNFNVLLSSEQKPNYIICVDSSMRNDNVKTKHLIKLAKFADCPVFYLNSANYFDDNLQFNGDIILINEDFKVMLNTFYATDRLIIFDIDNEDGTEILLKDKKKDKIIWVKKNNNVILEQNLNVIKKHWSEGNGIAIDCAQYPVEDLIKIKKEIKNCKLVKFSDNMNQYKELIDVAEINICDFYNELFFNKLSKNDKEILKTIILQNYSG
jgi:predicted amidohydrolase